MRFSFREIPDPAQTAVRARPILDVVVEGLDLAPQACLIDSGATAVRFGTHVADLCGVDLVDSPRERIAVGGTVVTGSMAEVSMRLDDGQEAHEWSAQVWFCDPWMPAFGLLGLNGFFDHFVITIAAYEERIDLRPMSR